jgi:integrase
MARKRKGINRGLPAGVYRGTSGYYVVRSGEYLGTIAPLTATLDQVKQAYREFIPKSLSPYCFESLSDLYFKGHFFEKLKPRTKKDYRNYTKPIIERLGKGDCRKLRPHDIRRYMDHRSQTSVTGANREKTFMSIVFNNAISYNRMDINPCVGVRAFTESSRERYITDSEYKAILKCSPPAVAVAVQLAYLMGLRRADVLGLKWSDIKNGEVHIKEEKTGKYIRKEITGSVEKALAEAKKIDGVASLYVVHTQTGTPYTGSGFSAMYRRAVKKAGIKDATFHDLRRKGGSDYEGRTKEFTGHSSDKIAEGVYNVKGVKSPSLK